MVPRSWNLIYTHSVLLGIHFFRREMTTVPKQTREQTPGSGKYGPYIILRPTHSPRKKRHFTLLLLTLRPVIRLDLSLLVTPSTSVLSLRNFDGPDRIKNPSQTSSDRINRDQKTQSQKERYFNSPR